MIARPTLVRETAVKLSLSLGVPVHVGLIVLFVLIALALIAGGLYLFASGLTARVGVCRSSLGCVWRASPPARRPGSALTAPHGRSSSAAVSSARPRHRAGCHDPHGRTNLRPHRVRRVWHHRRGGPVASRARCRQGVPVLGLSLGRSRRRTRCTAPMRHGTPGLVALRRGRGSQYEGRDSALGALAAVQHVQGQLRGLERAHGVRQARAEVDDVTGLEDDGATVGLDLGGASRVCRMTGIAAVCSLRISSLSKLKRTRRTPSACMTVRETLLPR